ncbi:MAG: DUF1583 domain-containing protein [Isosphaeraceae bacterium]|nr:DUF1583 domain-containing protein [Isosphaeraceae bacterium]
MSRTPILLGLCGYVVVAASLAGRTPEARAQKAAADAADADEGRERQTMERFLAILEKNPRRGTALDRVYGYHVERGSLETFLKTYQERAAKDPKDGNAWLLLGLLEAQRGRDAAAVAALKKAEETRADDPLASFYLGQALVLIGQPDAAAEALERAIDRKPGRADLLPIFQALGRVHQRAYHTQKALEVWNRLEALFPDDARVQEQIASTLAEENDPARALPRYEALAKKATDPYRKTQFRMDAADLKVRLNKQKEALADFESLLGQLNPDSWLYREVRRRIEEVFLRNDDQAGLATYYETYLKQAPEDVEAMARLGRTLAALGRAKEAQGWFDKAVKLAPSRKELRLALVDQLVQEKKFTEAAAQYEAMAKTDPSNPDLIREWGRLLLKDTGRPEAERKQAAAAVWRKLVEAKPNDAPTAVLVADLFRQAEMADEAVALYQKAIALAPEAPQYYEYLGEYYHHLKKTKEAMETWGKIADGKNRTAKNLGRLAEVLSGFGYTKEALVPSAEACTLGPDEFDLQLKYAELLLQTEKYDDTLKQLDAAAKAADDVEQSEAVLTLQIKTFEASEQLEKRIDALKAELDAGRDATGERWRRLARYYEAGSRLPEATVAIGKSVALDAKSVPSWTAYARVHEASGDFGGAVEAYRKLAGLDRRALTEYLTQVAKLESKLGRRDAALKAGREVLAAAPGNPESYQFFSELCTQLGEVDEGLDALRRAVRVNPNDNKALMTLGEALAREFRTEEAIELYWRAFEKAPDLDNRLGIVARLTDLYLQRNQFDRLVARLEREEREAKQPREMSICLAQAYQSSGDYGAARAQMERLLAANPRDTALLQQLSSLAETDGDLANAAKYQRQLNDVAPSDESSARLAQLYLRAGEASEAEAIWTRMASGKQETHRILQTIENLLGSDKAQTAQGVAERLLRDHPDLWDGLYLEGVTLAKLEKPDEAAKRFRALLDLRVDEDEESEEVKAAKKTKIGRPAGTNKGTAMRRQSRYAQPQQVQVPPIQTRIQSVWQIRQATGLESRDYYNGGMNRQPVWTPADFGQARVAALGWLLQFAQKKDKIDALVQDFRDAKVKAPRDARKLWDWYYLCLLRQENGETHDAALALSRLNSGDPISLWVYLTSLPARAVQTGQPQQQETSDEDETEVVDKTPPLPADELDHALATYRTLKARRPDLADISVISAISIELRRAQRKDESQRLYEESIAARDDLGSISAGMALATQRHDVKTMLALADRYVQREGNALNAQGMNAFTSSFIQLMAQRSKAKAHADVLMILDHYFDWYDQPDAAARRLRAQHASSAMPGQTNQVQFNMQFGKNYQWVTVAYPLPNAYFDTNAIQMLRAAFEVFKRDDLLSDLQAHARQRVDKAPEADRLYELLAQSYLQWWADDRDESIRTLTRAADLTKGDPDLRLGLAEIRAERGETEDALAAVDAIDATDQKTMQRREIMALRFAVLAGNVARARLASERLFNLRLDTNLQVQLAAQMHQLGMHDLAEAVLARARRRAGSNIDTLVGLMQQYQRQNKMDVAVQVAHQILRRAPARAFNPYQDQNDTAHREAIQVLARSGKLQELIDRVEAQLKTSPNSVQLLQTLADYHKAANEPAKAKAALERIAALRADDAQLRYQMGMDLIRAGDSAAAVVHLKAAITKEPSLFGYRYWEIENAFQQAGKSDDLAAIFDTIDLKKLGNYWSVQQLVQRLFQEEKTRDRAMKLFRKMWKAFPNERSQLISNLYSDEAWRQPEMYDYVREAIIPGPTQKLISRWAGLDQIHAWGGGGQVYGVTEHLLGAAEKQNKLDALTAEITAAVKRVPEWTAGEALLALIKVRKGKIDDAKKDLEAILAKDTKKEPIPVNSRILIGQQIENHAPLEPIAIALYEKAFKQEYDQNGLDYEYHPVRRLVALYRKKGRAAEARDIVLTFAKKPDNTNWGDPNYAAYRKVESTIAIGQELLDLGFPADAVPLYNEVLSKPDTLRLLANYGNQEYITKQLREGMSRGLRGLDEKTLAPTLRSLLKPGPGREGQAVDLVLLVYPRELDRARVMSLFAEALHTAAKKPELVAEVRATLADLAKKRADDLSVLIAQALAASAFEGSPGAFDEAAARLLKQAESTPLETLAEGTRANARQRAEAGTRLGLWLVARDCWTRAEARKTGDRLAAIALEGARRQADPVWSLAMLREWGQVAIDRGDTAESERLWGQMLEQTLAVPATGTTPAPAGEKSKTGTPKAATLAMTLDRFELAAQVAKAAARRGLSALSLHAVHEALRGGPPVVPLAINENRGGMVIQRNNNNNDQTDTTARTVEERLADLDITWERLQAPPAAVYETLRDAVLPESRPAEIFLYPRPLDQSVSHPRSVAGQLARWAVRADRVADLKKRIDARRGQPLAELEADVLTALLGLAASDPGISVPALEALGARLKKDSLQTTAERACLAGLPALGGAKTGAAALPVIERAVANLSGRSGTEPLAGLQLALAQAHYDAGQANAGRKNVQEYQAVLMRTMPNYGGDYGLYVRKQNLQKAAAEFARFGQWADALDVLGQFVDAPAYRGGDPTIGNVLTMLARELSKAPAAERYERLKAWTMPAPNRQSIRLLASLVPLDVPPAPFGSFPTSAFDDGVVSTAGMLIAAAREADKIDELAREAQALADRRLENAEPLLILAQIARELSPAMKPRINARVAQLKEMLDKRQAGPVRWSDVLVLRACLRDRALWHHPAEELTGLLVREAQNNQNWAFLALLRRGWSLNQVVRSGGSSTLASSEPGLTHWHAATMASAEQHAGGFPPAWWAESEGYIRHITGQGDQSLLFDLPLTGTFEFSVDAWNGGWAEGHAGYGGLVFEPNNQGVSSGVFPFGRSERVNLPSHFIAGDEFNRLTVQVEPGEVRYLVNGHLFYRDTDPSPTAPWLTIFCSRERQSTFRNPTVTGSPTIPREVALSHGDRLEGWSAAFFGQSQPPRRSLSEGDPKREVVASEAVLDQYDWSSRDGVIQCRRTEPGTGNQAVESRLYYVRPLREGDSLSYEFYYEPGAVMVHPALDRLTFLLEPEGVRLHWITDGENEWTGLKPGNSVEDASLRQGTDKLPLKARAWNAAKVAIVKGSVVVSLNGVEVARRALEPSNSRQFGFFHFRDRTAAQARNVVLTGSWAKALPADLAARDDAATASRGDRVARHELLGGEETFARSAASILKAARALPPAQRYERLAAWVLPQDGRPDYRLGGVYTPTDAAPPVATPGVEPPDNLAEERLHTGGVIDAPALQLVALAKQLGKLDALAAQVEADTSEWESVRHGRLALLGLIHIAQKRDDDALQDLAQLAVMARALPQDAPVWRRWPEQLAQWAALGRPKLRQVQKDLTQAMVDHWNYMNGHGVWVTNRDQWGFFVMYSIRRGQMLETPPAQRDEGEAAVQLPLWSRAEHATAKSRAMGSPIPRWWFENNALHHGQGHREDYLYLNVPIQGDFTVDYETQVFDANQMQIAYGAVMTFTRWDRKATDITQFGKPKRSLPIEPPLNDTKWGEWYPVRLSVKDNTYSVYVQGRKVFEEPLIGTPDPWLAIHQQVQGSSALRNFHFTGKVTVPASIALSTRQDLTGWLADYYEERVGAENPSWTKQGEEIVGLNLGSDDPPTHDRWGNEDTSKLDQAARIGSKQESLLQYHRPMVEDGVMDYEFFYVPGKTLVHPALDRLALLVDPEGIKLHWLTDGKYDRTGLSPANVAVEAKSRRGPSPLPLKPNAWNRMSLALKGNTLTLTLNGELVFERSLEATNQRTFGFFHYADETEARVRNVVYRGEWPKQLPAEFYPGQGAEPVGVGLNRQ